MNISRILFLSLSLLLSAPIVFAENDEDTKPKVEQLTGNSIEKETNGTKLNVSDSVEKIEDKKQDEVKENVVGKNEEKHQESEQQVVNNGVVEKESSFEKAKKIVLVPWEKSVEKTAILVTSVAGFKYIKDNAIGSALTKHKDVISKGLLISSAVVAIYGGYKLYKAFTQKEAEDTFDFELYDYSDDAI